MKKIIITALAILLIDPSIALAAWWNPLTWFGNWGRGEIKKEQVATSTKLTSTSTKDTEPKVAKESCGFFLDIKSCSASEKCKIAYKNAGPGRDITGMPLDNRVFDKCVDLTPAEIIQKQEAETARIKSETEYCNSRGGSWAVESSHPKGWCLNPLK